MGVDIMVEIQNNWIIVSKDESIYMPLSMDLTFIEKGRRVKLKNGKTITTRDIEQNVFIKDDNDNMYIPTGIYWLIADRLQYASSVVDNRSKGKLLDEDKIKYAIEHIQEYEDILDGIILKPSQIIALKKILHNKNCIAQLTTGAGKTEILCALTKILADINDNKYPTVLIFEPTIKLVTDTVDRFNKYDIKANNYSKTRKIIENCVNICHPSALGNDLRKDNTILHNIDALFCDECHHMRSDSCLFPVNYMPNVSYRVGVSASAINQAHVNGKELKDFTYDELMIMGATGKLVLNVTASMLIDNETLAKPVLAMMRNPADEPLASSDTANWHAIVKIKLESDNRTQLIANVASFFHNKERKTLILVNTKSMAHLIAQKLYDLGLGDVTRQSYGSGVFEKYNGFEFDKCEDDVFNKFKNNQYTILIGTSHLVEGVDVPNLDAVILAFAGKGERQHVQSIGRVLRKTKTGKYAWIIDFTDNKDAVLSNHSRIRLSRYQDVIGIPKDRVFINLNLQQLEEKFNQFEG